MTHLFNCYTSSRSLLAGGIKLTPSAVTLLIAITIQPLMAQSSLQSDLQIAKPSDAVQQVAGVIPAVQLLAAEYNPYDDSQLESLVVAARQQQEAGNHEAAITLFERAWQSVRVSYGLYDPSQEPLIESMIASEIELEDWQAIDDHFSYLELLYTRLYDVSDEALELGLQKVSSWHINAFNLNLDGKREQHLRKARDVLKRRLEVANNTLPEDHPRFDFLHQSIRLSEQHLYLMSERYKEQLRKQQRAERDRLLATLD